MHVPAGLRQAGELAKPAHGVGQVVQHTDRHCEVEAALLEREPFGVRLDGQNVGWKIDPRDVNGPAEVDRHHLCPVVGRLPAMTPRARADVDDCPSPELTPGCAAADSP